MKIRRILVLAAVLLLSASMFTGCMTLTPVRTITTGSYENPQWAPPYYSGARYYYLPDLELYYDLGSREFIYLMDGRWNFSPYIPAMYRDYDLDNSFCIVMNVNVYKPWLHHQYYVSHYPRYYYRDYYDHSNIPYVRAYNENIRSAVYWNQNERHRARPYDDVNIRDNRRFKYSKEDKTQQKNWTKPNQGSGAFGGGARGEQQNNVNQNRNTTRPANTTTTRPDNQNQQGNQQGNQTSTRSTTTTNTRQTTTREETPDVRNNRTNYYGRTIGNSVKVTKEMKDKKATPARKETTTAPARKSREATTTPPARKSREATQSR